MGQALEFHELDGCGTENDQHVRIESFTQGAMDLIVNVKGDDLGGIDKSNHATRLTGGQLLGAMFKLYRTDTKEYFDVVITNVGQTDFWVGPGKPVTTYTFKYGVGHPRRRPTPQDVEGFQPLCAGKHLSPEAQAHHPDGTVALVFNIDRYDSGKKTVTAQANECWFNVACAGSAPAKMHLLRHTDAGSIKGSYETSVPERQAMLKMITDDICGKGHTFTQDGEDVFYMDRHAPAWHGFPSGRPVGSLEAIWSKDGAICLDEARRYQEEKALGHDIDAEIATYCTRPRPCANIPVNLSNWSTTWTTVPDSYGFSANP
jgi:hypothetical protein